MAFEMQIQQTMEMKEEWALLCKLHCEYPECEGWGEIRISGDHKVPSREGSK